MFWVMACSILDHPWRFIYHQQVSETPRELDTPTLPPPPTTPEQRQAFTFRQWLHQPKNEKPKSLSSATYPSTTSLIHDSDMYDAPPDPTLLADNGAATKSMNDANEQGVVENVMSSEDEDKDFEDVMGAIGLTVDENNTLELRDDQYRQDGKEANKWSIRQSDGGLSPAPKTVMLRQGEMNPPLSLWWGEYFPANRPIICIHVNQSVSRSSQNPEITPMDFQS